MFIAVGVDNEERIVPQLDETEIFMIIDRKGDRVKFVEKRERKSMEEKNLIEEIKDCRYVIAENIGPTIRNMLIDAGISPVREARTKDPVYAVKILR